MINLNLVASIFSVVSFFFIPSTPTKAEIISPLPSHSPVISLDPTIPVLNFENTNNSLLINPQINDPVLLVAGKNETILTSLDLVKPEGTASSIIKEDPAPIQNIESPSPSPESNVLAARIDEIKVVETSPTASPALIVTPSPVATPEVKLADIKLSNGGLDADKLFSLINNYRQTLKLSSFQKDDKSCQLASDRAPEVANEITSGTMHKGMYGRKLSYWNTENIISMNSEEAAFNWWIHDQIHKEAIEGNYTYSCVACSGNSCAQEFTNYLAK